MLTPNQELDKSFDPKTIEAKWYAFWESKGYYAAGFSKPTASNPEIKDNFCILLPPPNVTGTLHMGHGFNGIREERRITLYDKEGP